MLQYLQPKRWNSSILWCKCGCFTHHLRLFSGAVMFGWFHQPGNRWQHVSVCFFDDETTMSWSKQVNNASPHAPMCNATWAKTTSQTTVNYNAMSVRTVLAKLKVYMQRGHTVSITFAPQLQASRNCTAARQKLWPETLTLSQGPNLEGSTWQTTSGYW